MRYLASLFCVCTVLISALSAFDDAVRAEDLDAQSGMRPSIWPPVQAPNHRDDQAPPTQKPPSRVDQRSPAQQRAHRNEQAPPVQQLVYRDDQGPPGQPRAYREEQGTPTQRVYRDDQGPSGQPEPTARNKVLRHSGCTATIKALEGSSRCIVAITVPKGNNEGIAATVQA
jgi:hypothetical protein